MKLIEVQAGEPIPSGSFVMMVCGKVYTADRAEAERYLAALEGRVNITPSVAIDPPADTPHVVTETTP